MPSAPPTRRWALLALAVYAAFAAVVALLPVSYADIVHGIADVISRVPGWGFFGSGWIEFGANVLLFIPLGALLTLAVGWPGGAAVAVGISVAFELAQLVIPDRQASVRDVISNAIGAALGALLILAIRRRRARSRSSYEGSAD